MSFKVTFVSGIVFLSLAQMAMTDCLSNQALSDLGFTNLDKKSYTNSTICLNAYNQYGGCVTTDSIKNFLNNVNSFLKNRIDDGSTFSGIFNNLKGKVVNIFSNANSTVVDTEIQLIKQKALDSRKACLRALSIVNHGTYCLLTSQGATNFATDFGSYIEVRANLATVGLSLDDCLPLIDATCTSVYGNPISSTAIYAINSTAIVDITNSTCTDLKAYAGCVSEGCAAGRRTLLINQIFVGNDIKFVPPKSTLDKIGDFYNQAIDKIKSFFKRRLATVKIVKLSADSSTGKDLVADGVLSGVEIPVAASTGVIFAGTVAVLVALFA